LTVQLKQFKFALSDEIYWKWRKDEAELIIISGEFGKGKSSCAIQILRELYEGDEWKKYMVFKPEQFLGLVDDLMSFDPPKKVPAIVWDDAGLWLYAMEFSDPRVVSVVKFLNVMRTVVGGLILTTPTDEMIVRKIPTLPGTRLATVTEGHRKTGTSDIRRFSVAKTIRTKWGKKFVKDYMEDYFNVMLPQEVYNYYKPLRDGYAREANILMRQAWRDRLKALDPTLPPV